VTKPVVLIAEELSPAPVEALGPDFTVRNVDGTDRPVLLSAVADADAILVRSATKVDAEVLGAAKQLKVIARAGVGLDNGTSKRSPTLSPRLGGLRRLRGPGRLVDPGGLRGLTTVGAMMVG
jgi:D-3-phosphoglycerate dehydrogenase